MNNYLLSIFIPTYNRSEIITDTINMFLDYANQYNVSNIIQIVVGDNNSKDGSWSKIDKIQSSNYSCFKNKKNIGITKNILKGLDYLSGHYVWIFGDDDLISFSVFKSLINFLRNKKARLIRLLPQGCSTPEEVKYLKEIESFCKLQLIQKNFSNLNLNEFIYFEKKAGFITSFIYENELIQNTVKKILNQNNNELEIVENAYFCKLFTLELFKTNDLFFQSSSAVIAARQFGGGSHFNQSPKIYFKTFHNDELDSYEYFKEKDEKFYSLLIRCYYQNVSKILNFRTLKVSLDPIKKRFSLNRKYLPFTVKLKYFILLYIPYYILNITFSRKINKYKSVFFKLHNS